MRAAGTSTPRCSPSGRAAPAPSPSPAAMLRHLPRRLLHQLLLQHTSSSLGACDRLLAAAGVRCCAVSSSAGASAGGGGRRRRRTTTTTTSPEEEAAPPQHEHATPDGHPPPAPSQPLPRRRRASTRAATPSSSSWGAAAAAAAPDGGAAAAHKPPARRAAASAAAATVTAPSASAAPSTRQQQQQQQQQQQPQPQHLDGGVAFGAPPLHPAFYSRPARPWVAFADLHLAPRTLQTCLQVLRRVRREAEARGAGVAFLGDWWDRRGDLNVVALNRVLEELSGWSDDTPLLLLVGNHDQVDAAGKEHALRPLALAAPAAHAFTEPTLFNGALFVPYRRDPAAVTAAIEAARGQMRQQGQPLRAIFGHADVLTAHMNASWQARDGLPPGAFPADVPVYLGHYHYPQTLAQRGGGGGAGITYVGSPYQVSASEAGQRKRLLLLDEHWRHVEDIPLDVGRRHFRCQTPGAAAATLSPSPSPAPPPSPSSSPSSSSSGDEAALLLQQEEKAPGEAAAAAPAAAAAADNGELQLQELPAALAVGRLRRGDVVALRGIAGGDDERHLQEARALLAEQGVHVRLHVQPPQRAAARIAAAEQLSLPALLQQYADSVGMPASVLEAARAALMEQQHEQQQQQQQLAGPQQWGVGGHCRLELEAVEVEGFGPFRDRVVYPLAGRGVVAVTGRNDDDAAAASNGAGKTSLLTSLLWAFKAPDGRRMAGRDYVNEDARAARVRVTGAVNGAPFELVRTASAGSGGSGSSRGGRSTLTLRVAGEDLTQQEQRLTEQVLEARFAASLLPRALVFTQEDLLGLLHSNDASFKAMLASVVDTSPWAAARERAAARVSDLKQRAASAGAVIGSLEGAAARGEAQLAGLREQQAAWAAARERQLAAAETAEAGARHTLALAAAEGRGLQAQLAAGQAAAAALEARLQADAAAAAQQAEAAVAAADADSEEAAAAAAAGAPKQQQPQQQPQQPQQEELPVFDEAAAAAALAPLLAAEEAAADEQRSAAAVVQLLRGQLAAARARRKRYEKVVAAGNSSTSAGAAAHQHQHDDSGGDGPAPVCEQCLQPIDASLYRRNLADMAAEEGGLQAQLEAAAAAEAAARSQAAAARDAVAGQRQAQAAEAAAVRAQREAIIAAAERAARASAEQERALRQQEAERRRAAGARRQAAWAEAQRLAGEAGAAQRRREAAAAAAAQLEAALASIAARLGPLEEEAAAAAAAAATSAATTTAETAAAIDRLCAAARQVCARVAGAVDAALGAAAARVQLAGAADPHASGVATAEAQLAATRAELAGARAEEGALREDAATWRGAEAAFGRSGVPSFLLEDVLGELQAACSRHLAQLADGMSLELSATSARRSSSSSGSASAGGGGKRRKQQKAAAAAAAASEEEEDNDDDSGDEAAAVGARRGVLAVAAAAASGGDTSGGDDDNDWARTTTTSTSSTTTSSSTGPLMKEEIAKRVRVRGAGGVFRERGIAQLSGGERKRVALALGLAFAEVAAARGRLSSNVLVLDEVLASSLDEEGCARVAALLRTLAQESVFVVGQAGSFVVKQFAAVDVVVKRGGAAHVALGGGGGAEAAAATESGDDDDEGGA